MVYIIKVLGRLTISYFLLILFKDHNSITAVNYYFFFSKIYPRTFSKQLINAYVKPFRNRGPPSDGWPLI